MGELTGYNVGLSNGYGKDGFVMKCDYSNDCGSILAGQQGTSAANYSKSNLVYTGSTYKTISAGEFNNMATGISIDDYIKGVVENLWCSGQLKECNEDVDGEVTIPPMRGFIEI